MTGFGPDHLAVYVCHHVFTHERPVLLVSHDDGDWQFLCGGPHEKEEIPHVIGVSHIVGFDPTVSEVADIGVDEKAERESVAHPWVRRA
jgi:hypothetical protein